MAEKGFGVKEVNLIGASGTPTITSPNNLNLNANNVAISTNATIGGTLAVSGTVSVGGTLTYEDVTNIDSVGVITARSGVDVDDFISVGSNIHLGNAGVVTATTFSGSAASLTSVPAANITGTLPAISGANLTGITITPTNSDIQVVYTVTANGSSAYRFAGNGVVSTADDPDLYLMRGQKYRFINNSGGSHPFQIRTSAGADGAAYSTGVTNNGASSGNIDFVPTYDSPAQLVYQCTSHSGMVGNIYLRSAGGNETNVGVTTFASTATLSVNRIIPVGGVASSGGTTYGGGIIQVVQTVKTNEVDISTSSQFNDISGVTATITPKSNTSKILVTVCLTHNVSSNSNLIFRLLRGSTPVGNSTVTSDSPLALGISGGKYDGLRGNPTTFQFLDSPATTSATVYKVQEYHNAGTFTLNYTGSSNQFSGSTTITLMEVSG